MTQQTFQLERLTSPVGVVMILTDDAGRLRAVDFSDYEERLHRLLRRHYGKNGYTIAERAAPSAAYAALEAYFAGDLAALDGLAVETGGTPFQRTVWAALRDIPAGRTESYGALAKRIGKAGASRAVGLANGSNPIAIVVPCHRVIGADSSLTGYGGGMARKRWLLEHEGIRLTA
jgi:O-6-methylguanine DNA methyltransferase